MAKKPRRRLLYWILGGAVLFLCVCPLAFAGISGIGQGLGLLPPSTPKPTTTVTPEPTSTFTPGPSDTPTATPPPAATLTREQALRSAVADTLSSSNRGVERIHEVSLGYLGDPGIIFVSFAINDNLTQGMVRGGARLDVKNLVRAIDESRIDFTGLWLFGTFSMVDAFGNAEEMEVVKMFYDRATVDRINWDSFLTDNIYVIADDEWVHPAFQD